MRNRLRRTNPQTDNDTSKQSDRNRRNQRRSSGGNNHRKEGRNTPKRPQKRNRTLQLRPQRPKRQLPRLRQKIKPPQRQWTKPRRATREKEATTTEEEKTTAAKENTEALTELTYENDEVKITVSANTENAIPEGTTLQVVPVVNSGDTAGQYQEVEQQLGEKATEEEYDITGFLAYDISLIDEDGNEIEPDGEVQVSMDYKNSVSPAAEEKAITDSDATVMHLEEDENGQVKEVVDMAENSQFKQLDTTDKNEIQKTEFVTKSFSVFTITWKSWGEISIKLKYVDTSGSGI